MPKRDVSQLIERLDRFEQRAHIQLKGLSAFADEYEGEQTITVRGDAYAFTPTVSSDFKQLM